MSESMKKRLEWAFRVFFPRRVKSGLSLWQRIKMNRISYLMMAPYFVLFTIFTIIPVAASLVLGFTYFNMLEAPVFTGLSNYVSIFLNDEIFQLAIKNTIIFALLTGPVSYVLCFILAMRRRFRETFI